MQRYGGRSLQCVSRKQSMMGDEISWDPLESDPEGFTPLIAWVLQSHCKFLSWGGTGGDLVLERQVRQQLTVIWKERKGVLEIGRPFWRQVHSQIRDLEGSAADTGGTHATLFLYVGPRVLQTAVSCTYCSARQGRGQ